MFFKKKTEEIKKEIPIIETIEDLDLYESTIKVYTLSGDMFEKKFNSYIHDKRLTTGYERICLFLGHQEEQLPKYLELEKGGETIYLPIHNIDKIVETRKSNIFKFKVTQNKGKYYYFTEYERID